MSDLPLARHAGPIAIVAGALLVLTDLARLVGGHDVADVAADPLTILAASRSWSAACWGSRPARRRSAPRPA